MSAITHPNNHNDILAQQCKRQKSQCESNYTDNINNDNNMNNSTTDSNDNDGCGNNTQLPHIHVSSSTPNFTRNRTPLIFPTGVVDHTGACHSSHVIHRRASADSPPTPSLVGRQYQRYDGKVRLVCGCVPFRLDLINHDVQAEISPIPQPVPNAPPLYIESETSDVDEHESDMEHDHEIIRNGVKVIQSQPRILTPNDSPTNTNDTTTTHDTNKQHTNSTINTTPLSPPSTIQNHSTTHADNDQHVPSDKRLQLCVLLIRASHKEQWVFPKGGWENFETSQQCAQRESLEEAGVEGIIVAELGSIEFIRKGKKARLLTYLLQVTQQHEIYSELHRNRQWVPVEQCRSLLSRPESIHAFDQAVTVWKSLGLLSHNQCIVDNTTSTINSTTTLVPRTYSTSSSIGGDNDSVILHSTGAPSIINLNNGQCEQLLDTGTLHINNTIIDTPNTVIDNDNIDIVADGNTIDIVQNNNNSVK